MSSNIASPNRETQGPVDQNDREAMAPSRVLQGLPYVHVDSKPSPSGTLPTSAPGLNVEGPGDKERVGSGHSTINGDTEVEVLSASYIRPQSRTRRALLVSILAFTCFLSILNVQSVVIMLPSISLALDIPSHRQQMITSIYTISSGCLILLWGRLADVYGRRPIYLIGSAVFAIASINIPFSPNEICFYALRALQGMSSAATVSSAVGILTSAFPIGKSRNKAFVIFSAAASLGSILGNLAGGVIGGFLSWKWVFWIPAIPSVLATIMAVAVIPSPQPSSRHEAQGSPTRFVDWLGAATVSSSLLLLLVALAEANVVGWTTPWILALIVVSIVLAVLFVFWQRHLEKNSTQQPLMKVTMFKNLQFSAIFVIICCFYGSFNSFLIFATYFYQDYLGLGVLDTTLRFIPAGVTGFLVSFVVPRALSRVPGFYILIFGVLCGITSPLLFALPSVTQTTSYWAYGFPAMCLCLSVDVFWPVASLFISQQLPEEDQALGSALLQTSNQVGRSLGLAIGTGVQTAVEGSTGTLSRDRMFLNGLRAAQGFNAGLALVALIFTVGFQRKLGKAS